MSYWSDLFAALSGDLSSARDKEDKEDKEAPEAASLSSMSSLSRGRDDGVGIAVGTATPSEGDAFSLSLPVTKRTKRTKSEAASDPVRLRDGRLLHRVPAAAVPDAPTERAAEIAMEARRSGAVLVADGATLIAVAGALPHGTLIRLRDHAGEIIALLRGEHRRRRGAVIHIFEPPSLREPGEDEDDGLPAWDDPPPTAA